MNSPDGPADRPRSLIRATPQRILVICEGQLGDLIILGPALRAMKESFPSSSLSLLAVQRRTYTNAGRAPSGVLSEPPEAGTCDIYRFDPLVDQIAEVDRATLRLLSGARRARAELSILSWIRKGRFDLVLCAFPQDRFFLWAFLSGAGIRVGERKGPMARLLTNRIEGKRHRGGVLRYYCALAEASGAEVRSHETKVHIPEAAKGRADELWRLNGWSEGTRVVAVHPGASGLYRVWPPERYASLVDHLQGIRKIPVLLCGSAFDREMVEEVRRCSKTAPWLLPEGEGVLVLGAVLQACALCISNNSGPRHLAIAVGTPSLALIPRYDDLQWKIYEDEQKAGTMQSALECPGCPSAACWNLIPPGERFGSFCMRALSLEAVRERVDLLLEMQTPASAN
ncbi:MAG TPA: glycosyltransferase family 9 protein [Bacteroidota bacterium]|nr:glycosyltransferase family 9 protein [Bacteroidota bacterium]